MAGTVYVDTITLLTADTMNDLNRLHYTILGDPGSAGAVLTVLGITAAARTVLDDATVSAMVDTLGGAASTGTGGLARATSPTLVTPALGTPASGILTSCTGLPAGGLSATATDKLFGRSTAGAGAGEEIACTAAARTVLDDATVSAMVDTLGGAASTGTGGLVRTNSPTLITPALGTPASGDLTSCTSNTETAANNSTQLATTAYADRLTAGTLAGAFTTLSASPASDIVPLTITGVGSATALYVKITADGGDIRFGKQPGLDNEGIFGTWTNSDFVGYRNSFERIRLTSTGLAVTGAISGTSIQNTPIGSTTASTGAFTTLTVGGVNVLTTATGLPLAGGTLTGDITMSGASIFHANASIAAHATTCDPWSLGNYVTLTGGAVTFTGLANAPQAGAEVELYMNAAHTFTDGAVFEVDGNANFTASIGDRVLLRAKSTTIFTVHPRKADGTAVADTSLAAASQTEMEAASSNAVAATPGRTKYHPGVAKAWAYVTVSGGTPTLQTSHNVTSITDTAAGKLTVTMTTAFSSANWAAVGLAAIADGNTQGAHESSTTAKTASAILLVNVAMGSGAATDPVAWNFVGYGDQ